MNEEKKTNNDNFFMKNGKISIKGIAIFTLLFGAGAFLVGQIDKKLSTYSWKNDYKQTSFENIDVSTDFFWDKGDSLQRFLIKSRNCKSSTDWIDMEVKIASKVYDYMYACNDDGYAIIAGKGFNEIARTMHQFEVAERYGKDVEVVLWGKVYTFDAAGYKQAIKDSNAYYRSL